MMLNRQGVCRASFLYADSVQVFDDFVHMYAVLVPLCEDIVQNQ